MGEFSIDKLLLFTIFFVPGFIYLKAFRLFIAETKTDFSKDLYEAIGISLINAIALSPLLYVVYTNNFIENCLIAYYFSFIFIVIIAPICEAWIFHQISKTNWYSKYLLTPNNSAWDDFFSKREPYWVIVTLKSGRKIAGKYGSKSYASVAVSTQAAINAASFANKGWLSVSSLPATPPKNGQSATGIIAFGYFWKERNMTGLAFGAWNG